MLPILTCAGLLLGFDALVSMALQRTETALAEIDLQKPSQLLVKLDCLRRFEGFKVVVLGDSLVYGQAMQSHGDAQWRQHTLAASFGREIRKQRPGEDVLVLNLGINGALPADLEALARLIVPCRVDLLMFDTHLRPFSADFATSEAQFARPWLKELQIDASGRVTQLPNGASRFEQVESSLDAWLMNHWSLYRARHLVQQCLVQSTAMEWGPQLRKKTTGATDEAPSSDDLVLLMQLKSRLESVHFREDHPQRQAIERLLAYLREHRQPTIVFYARENPELLPDLLPNERYRQLYGELVNVIEAQSGPTIAFVPPVAGLNPRHYLDFLHLNAAGYEVLAAQLAAQAAAQAGPPSGAGATAHSQATTQR